MTKSIPKLAYLGPEGSHSHQAALRLVADERLKGALVDYELVSYASLNTLIEAVSAGKVQFGMMPVENALEGSVIESIEALGGESYSLDIVLECSYPVIHCLIQKGGKERPILSVMSHPQALGQCRETLKTLFGNTLEKEAMSSTSEAVQQLADAEPSCAAIGTERAAQLYGMTVVRRDMSDSPDNVTRFMLITSAKSSGEKQRFSFLSKTESVKTFLCMGLEERPGVLVDMLLVLKAYGINMTRIESRPNRQDVGTYRFFIDVEKDLKQPEYERVNMYLEADTTYLKTLGPYYALGHLQSS